MNLVINRAEWLRGEGEEVSALLRTVDEKRCCVGIYLRELGVPDDDMRGMGTADASRITGHIGKDHWLVDKATVDACVLYDTNDTLLNDETREEEHILQSEAEREAKIAAVFAKHGVIVTFKG